MDDVEWLRDELLTGFQALVTLSLDRQPAREVLPGSVQVWLTALTHRLVWDRSRDTPRIREAFVTLARTRQVWPRPSDLLAALPPLPQRRALPARAADPERSAAAIAEIASLLRAEPART